MEQNENKIIIVDEQGRERVCEILFTYQHPETEKNYVVLYPIDELDSDDEEMDLFAYSFIENEDGDIFGDDFLDDDFLDDEFLKEFEMEMEKLETESDSEISFDDLDDILSGAKEQMELVEKVTEPEPIVEP